MELVKVLLEMNGNVPSWVNNEMRRSKKNDVGAAAENGDKKRIIVRSGQDLWEGKHYFFNWPRKIWTNDSFSYLDLYAEIDSCHWQPKNLGKKKVLLRIRVLSWIHMKVRNVDLPRSILHWRCLCAMKSGNQGTLEHLTNDSHLYRLSGHMD